MGMWSYFLSYSYPYSKFRTVKCDKTLNFRMLCPRIWTRTARGDDYHISYFENMQPGHRNFCLSKMFDPLATRLIQQILSS